MKKTLAVCLTLVLVLGFSLTSFAAGFVQSPSLTPAPEIVDVIPGSEDCTGEIVVTPFQDRDTLPESEKENLETAYDAIVSEEDLANLNKELAELAKDKGISSKDLAISDLFNMNYVGCEDHEQLNHGAFDITLKAETLRNFVGLMCLNNGKWELISGAEAFVSDGEYHLRFSTDKFGPFAIVVNTGAGAAEETPNTGDPNHIWIYAILMAVSAVALVVVWRLSKKQSA